MIVKDNDEQVLLIIATIFYNTTIIDFVSQNYQKSKSLNNSNDISMLCILSVLFMNDANGYAIRFTTVKSLI